MGTETRLPEGWSYRALSECVDVLDNRRKPVNSTDRASRIGDVPYYGATGQVGWIDDHLFDEELVLVGEDGAPFLDKSKPIAYIVDGKSWVNNHAHVLRSRSSVTTNQYIRYFLDAFDFSDYVRGSTRDKLTQGALNSIPVALAPRQVQDALVGVVDAVSGKRENALTELRTASRAVQRFRQSVLAAACSGRLTADWRDRQTELVNAPTIESLTARRRDRDGRRFVSPSINSHVDYSELPDEWTLAPLGLVLDEIKYGTSRRGTRDTAGTPVLRIPNISGRGLDLTDLKYSSLERLEAAQLALRISDVLMIRSNGSVQLVGKAVKVTPDAVGMAYAGYLMRLRPDTELVLAEYLVLAMQTTHLRTQIEMPARSTSGVNNINTGELRGLVIPLPALTEQAEIVRRTERLLLAADAILDQVKLVTDRAERIYQSVLAKAFRGDLDVTQGVGALAL